MMSHPTTGNASFQYGGDMANLTKRTTGDSALDIAKTWANMTPEEQRRRAMSAARDHHHEILGDLAIAHQKANGRLTERTRAAQRPDGNLEERRVAGTADKYRAAITALVFTWQDAGENLLRPNRDAGTLYIRTLEQRYAASTVRLHLAACTLLYRALRHVGATEARPFDDVTVKKTETRRSHEKRDAWSEEHVAAMLAHAEPIDAALLLLAARAGLRIAEALDLKWSDVTLDDRPRLIVRNGKGGKSRDVNLTPELTETLAELHATSTTEHVLPYRTPERARQRFDRLAARAGLERQPGQALHSLRHTAGTAVYEATGDLTIVQAWLGHADIATSRGYVHRSEKKLLADVAAKLPRLRQV